MIFFFPFFPKQQYQDSIKAHSAGRPVNLNDLPVPPGNFLDILCRVLTPVVKLWLVKLIWVFVCVFSPGCPPLQGSEGSQQNLIGVLETAMKIANQDADADDDDDDEDGQKEAAKVGMKKMESCTNGPNIPVQPGNLSVD